ncbi:hypothetical protein [Methylobacterium sp. J-070]|uniref:hypothetical protein n=1 Tax=Methylobacterium sp. J-070 TaxID=2836650 RepID=UPI001FBC0740|nr:hypothetical protein [Methylobacterium sp. J-070]MCJ2051207.1 hypothetical protein [Methylobacterium sp. J-070]
MSNDTAAPAPAKISEITAWPYEFPLSRAVEMPEGLSQVLVLQEPTAKDAFEFDLLTGLSAEQVRPLVARLAVTPPPFVDKIPAADIIALSARLSRFFSKAAA